MPGRPAPARLRSVAVLAVGVFQPGLRESLALGVLALDVGLEFGRLDPPFAAPADLDRGQLATSHQGVGLGRGDVEDLLNICQLQEPGWDGSLPRSGRSVGISFARARPRIEYLSTVSD